MSEEEVAAGSFFPSSRSSLVDKMSSVPATTTSFTSAAAASPDTLNLSMSALTFRHRRKRCRFRCSNRQGTSAASLRIVKKYRKLAKEMEYKRLRLIVPAVANRERASKAEILEEAIKYIDSLHRRLVESVQTKGIPPSLQGAAQHSVDPTGRAPDVSAVDSRNLDTDADGDGDSLSPDRILGLVRSSVQPDIERRLEQRRRMDEAAVHHILTARVVAATAGGGRGQEEEEEEGGEA